MTPEEQFHIVSEIESTMLGQFPGVKDALNNVIEQQRKTLAVSDRLKEFGVKSTDALSVGVFVEIFTEFEIQAHYERTLNLMVMMGISKHYSEALEGVSRLTLMYKSMCESLQAQAPVGEKKDE